jgi:hypothetical protein
MASILARVRFFRFNPTPASGRHAPVPSIYRFHFVNN